MHNNSEKQRIQEFVDVIMNVARGKMDSQLQLTDKNDDLDSLALGINMMIDDLKNNAHIKAQNKEIRKINKKLKKATLKAEESDRLKSAFLANMSHEIRTLLNGILGFCELLKEPDKTEEERESFIQIIETSGNRLLNIINDLINLSKIEAGQMTINKSLLNVNETIKEMELFFTPKMHKKGLNLYCVYSLPNDEVILHTDAEKLDAVLINLINNALKYTHEGEIIVAYRKTENNFTFSIADTGIGISKHQQHNIFNRFIKDIRSSNKDIEGAGLGLAITRSYVEMLGGEIWLESEYNKGSTFSFTLPL